MNGSHNRNVIKKISERNEGYEPEKFGEKEWKSGGHLRGRNLPPSCLWFLLLGIDPATGQEVFLNRNGEKTYIWIRWISGQ